MIDFGVPNFTFDELTKCSRGGAMAARNRALAKAPEKLASGQCLALLLQVLRDHVESPVDVVCALRYAEQIDGLWYGYDVAVQGDAQGSKSYYPKSQHTRFQAADVHCHGHDLDDVWAWLADECGHPFGQVINERRGGAHWLHVSIPGTSLIDGRWIEGECLSYVHGRKPAFRYERDIAAVRARWT